MRFTVVLKPPAESQYLAWKKDKPRVAAKIDRLLDAMEIEPFSGIGKPKHLDGFWSRRITERHRLVYTVEGGRVLVWSCYGHYGG